MTLKYFFIHKYLNLIEFDTDTALDYKRGKKQLKFWKIETLCPFYSPLFHFTLCFESESGTEFPCRIMEAICNFRLKWIHENIHKL